MHLAREANPRGLFARSLAVVEFRPVQPACSTRGFSLRERRHAVPNANAPLQSDAVFALIGLGNRAGCQLETVLFRCSQHDFCSYMQFLFLPFSPLLLRFFFLSSFLSFFFFLFFAILPLFSISVPTVLSRSSLPLETNRQAKRYANERTDEASSNPFVAALHTLDRRVHSPRSLNPFTFPCISVDVSPLFFFTARRKKHDTRSDSRYLIQLGGRISMYVGGWPAVGTLPETNRVIATYGN